MKRRINSQQLIWKSLQHEILKGHLNFTLFNVFHQFVFVKNTLLLYSLYEFNRFNAGRSIIEKMKNPILNITRSLNWIWYYSAVYSGKSLFRYILHSFIYDGGTKIHFSFFRIVFLTYPFWQMGTKELSRQSNNNNKNDIVRFNFV